MTWKYSLRYLLVLALKQVALLRIIWTLQIPSESESVRKCNPKKNAYRPC